MNSMGFYHDNELFRSNSPSSDPMPDASVLGIPRTVFDTSVTSETILEESCFMSFPVSTSSRLFDPPYFSFSPSDQTMSIPKIPSQSSMASELDFLNTEQVRLFWERYSEYPAYLKKQKKRIKRRIKRYQNSKTNRRLSES